MIAFLTLFLGLVTGAQLVELTVTDPAVASVELQLDGRVVAVLRGAPWSVTCDLGADLAPHELLAVGFDADGRKVGEAHQWVNLPRERAELELLLDADDAGTVSAVRLVWSSVDAATPEAIRVTFDGEPLTAASAGSFAIPAYDPTMPHLVQAELVAGGAVARAQAIVGGTGGEEVSRDLTALAFALGEDQRLPTPAEMSGWLRHGGGELRVVAVEQPGIDVVMVQDLDWALQGQLNRLRGEVLAPRTASQERPTGLKSQDEFRVMVPIPAAEADARTPSAQFALTPNLWAGQEQEAVSRGPGWREVAQPLPQGLLVAIPVNAETRVDTSSQTLADAVAAAGLAATAGRRGRAVLLVTGSEVADQSRHTPEEVRSYLAALGVPLWVWSPAPKLVDPAWGEVESISNRPQLTRAIRSLRAHLDRQVVVWVEGRYLPHQVLVTEQARHRLIPLSTRAASATDELTDAESAELEPATEPTAASAAEASQSPVADSTTTPTEPVDTTFVDSTDVRVVNVDVFATDGDGNAIGGLTREDFVLTEDGQPVEITFFQPPRRIRTRNDPPQANPAGLDTAPAGAERESILAVYLDLETLDRAQRSRALRALADGFARHAEAPRTLIAVAGDEVEIVLPFTTDINAIDAAIAELETAPPRPLRDGTVDTLNEMGRVQEEIDEAQRIRDDEERRIAVESALAHREAVERSLQVLAEQRRQGILRLLESLQRFAQGLSGVDGRRALLYVGERLTANPAEELFEEAARSMAAPSDLALSITGVSEESRSTRLFAEGSRAGLGLEIEAMIEKTAALGVTFYTLAPGRVDDGGSIHSSTAGSAGSRGRMAGQRAAAAKAAACQVAAGTGGLCQVGGTELGSLIDSTLADFRESYSLAFTPTRPADGEIHTLGVTTVRPGIDLRYRDSYRDHDAIDSLHQTLNSTLLLGSRSNPLEITLREVAQQPARDGRAQVVTLEIRVPTDRLALLPSRNPSAQTARARLLVAAMDEQGRSAGIQEFPLAFTVPTAQTQSGPPVYAHTIHLTLAPGRQQIAVGLWDEVGRQGSFERIEAEVGRR